MTFAQFLLFHDISMTTFIVQFSRFSSLCGNPDVYCQLSQYRQFFSNKTRTSRPWSFPPWSPGVSPVCPPPPPPPLFVHRSILGRRDAHLARKHETGSRHVGRRHDMLITRRCQPARRHLGFVFISFLCAILRYFLFVVFIGFLSQDLVIFFLLLWLPLSPVVNWILIEWQ